MAIPTVTYEVSFSSNEARTIGSIRITDTTNWASYGIDPADVEMAFGIVGPDGNAYRLPTIGQPGNIFPDVQLWQDFPLPTASNGTVQQGDYTVSMVARVSPPSPDPNDYEPDDVVANLCTDTPTLCLTTNPDCLRLIVTATDETQWEALGWTVNSRSMTLQYPSATYHATITGAGPSITTGGEPIWNGTWTATVTVSVTKDGYSLTLTTVKQFDVACDFDGCRLYCMLKNKFAQWQSAFERGDVRTQEKTRTDLEQMSVLSQMIAMSITCGDDTYLNTLMNRFKIVATGNANGDCDCCSSCSDPQQLVPIWNSGSGSTWTPIAGNNMTITPGVNSYTFAVSDAFANLVGSLYNTQVTSTGGTITVTSVTVGNVVTFNVETTKESPDMLKWTEIWEPNGATRTSGTIYVSGDAFVNTFSGAIYGFLGTQWKISNFMGIGGNVPYFVNAQITNIVFNSGYGSYAMGDNIEATIVERNADNFTVALVQSSDVIGGVTGARRKLNDPLWITYIASFDIEFTVERKMS